MTEATSDYLNMATRSFEQACNDVIAAPMKSAEPASYFLNMFRHVRSGELVPGDHTFADVNEAYEEISDGLTGYSYAFSVQITNKEGERTSKVVYLEDEARAWAADTTVQDHINTERALVRR